MLTRPGTSGTHPAIWSDSKSIWQLVVVDKMDLEAVKTKVFAGIIKGLNAKKYDAIMAAMSITADRKKLVTFSRNYAGTPNVFVMRKDNPAANFSTVLERLTLNDFSAAERAAVDAIINHFKGKVIGATKYLTKPFDDPDAVLAAVERGLA